MLENLSLTQCVACSCQTSNGWVHASGFQASTMPEAKGKKKKIKGRAYYNQFSEKVQLKGTYQARFEKC